MKNKELTDEELVEVFRDIDPENQRNDMTLIVANPVRTRGCGWLPIFLGFGCGYFFALFVVAITKVY